jgi:hypothetical protein
MKGTIASFPIPIFTLAKVDHITIDAKAHLFLAEQFPTPLPATLIVTAASTIAVEPAIFITVAPLGVCGRGRQRSQ